MAKKEKPKSLLGRIWYFIWYEDSWLSFFVDALLVIILGRFVVYPLIIILAGTSYPMVAVVSHSMDHQGLDFDAWWAANGNWYERNNITKEDFREFYVHNGFNKGDIFVVKGTSMQEIELGDIIVYSVTEKSSPIIHRVVSKDSNVLSTKGDANKDMISFEERIYEQQIQGKAIVRIPWLGWIKVFFLELFNL